MSDEKTLIHAIEIGREQRRLVATRTGADLDDGVAIVEGIARNEERLELFLQLGDARLEARQFGARLLGHLWVVNENELAYLRELVFVFAEFAGNVDYWRQSSVLSSEFGQSMRVTQRGRIGESAFDLGRPSQHVGESVPERQSRASGRLLAELLPEPLDASRGINEPLLPREERMALRAHVGVNLGLR